MRTQLTEENRRREKRWMSEFVSEVELIPDKSRESCFAALGRQLVRMAGNQSGLEHGADNSLSLYARTRTHAM